MKFGEVLSLILIIVMIVLLLIVVQVPYTTTNAINEQVPTENCTPVNIPFVSNFKTGLNYNTGLDVASVNGTVLTQYSKLKTYVYANIRNMGDKAGIYCIDTKTYLVTDMPNEGNESNSSSENLTFSTSQVCTENSIAPTMTDTIAIWVPSLLPQNLQEYNPNNVYVSLTVLPPTSEKCFTQYRNETTEQEVTRYCNAWKHVVGMC